MPKISMRAEVADDIRRIYSVNDAAEADRRRNATVARYHTTVPERASGLEAYIPETLTG